MWSVSDIDGKYSMSHLSFIETCVHSKPNVNLNCCAGLAQTDHVGRRIKELGKSAGGLICHGFHPKDLGHCSLLRILSEILSGERE